MQVLLKLPKKLLLPKKEFILSEVTFLGEYLRVTAVVHGSTTLTS